jgi:hypothetical protein
MMCYVLQLDLPHAYVCAESYIFDVTEWFDCQVTQIFFNENSDLFINFFYSRLILHKRAITLYIFVLSTFM